MAEALLNTMSRDQQEWENQIGYERFVHDCISREKYAFMKGEKLGVEHGAKANAIENAKNLLILDKLSCEEIAECCSLPLEEVQKLANELKTVELKVEN